MGVGRKRAEPCPAWCIGRVRPGVRGARQPPARGLRAAGGDRGAHRRGAAGAAPSLPPPEVGVGRHPALGGVVEPFVPGGLGFGHQHRAGSAPDAPGRTGPGVGEARCAAGLPGALRARGPLLRGRHPVCRCAHRGAALAGPRSPRSPGHRRRGGVTRCRGGVDRGQLASAEARRHQCARPVPGHPRPSGVGHRAGGAGGRHPRGGRAGGPRRSPPPPPPSGHPWPGRAGWRPESGSWSSESPPS